MSKDLATTDNNPLAMFGLTEAAVSEVPEFARGDAGAGDEGVGAEDQSTVTLAMLQPMTPGVASSKGAMQPGQWRNSVTQDVFDELYVSNIFYQKQFALFYKRTSAKEGLIGAYDSLAEAVAAMNAHPDYDKEDKRNQIEMIENGVHYVVVLDGDGVAFPAKIYMKGSALSISRDWNTKLASANNGSARFTSVWKLSNEERSNTKGTWWVPKVEFVGMHGNKELYESIKTIYTGVAASLSPVAQIAEQSE